MPPRRPSGADALRVRLPSYSGLFPARTMCAFLLAQSVRQTTRASPLLGLELGGDI